MYSPQDLAALLAVADTGSVRSAAAALGRTQPAVTQAIRRLEQAVGFALLDRSSYRARLTDRGETFVKRARITVSDARDLRRFASQLALGVEPRLRIAISGAIPTEAWISLLREVPARFPDTIIEVEAAEADRPLHRLMGDEAQLAILLTAPDRLGGSLHRKPLGSIAFVNVVRSDQAEQLQQRFARIPQILTTDFDDPAAGYGVAEGQRAWRVSNHRMKAAAIIAGAGWGLVPRSFVESQLEDGTLCTVAYAGFGEYSSHPFSLYRRSDRPMGPVASFIWDSVIPPSAE